MELATFAVEDRIEADHWWFVGRRKMFARILEEMKISKDARILDVGSGTGANLRMLRDLGYARALGLEYNPAAAALCNSKNLGPLLRGDARALPFPDNSFDFILATDIIEHIDDDERALSEIRRVLRPAGSVLITVPAFQSLWGLQDVKALHQRRYRRKLLLSRMKGAGLNVLDSYYFNYLLFVPIWVARQVLKIAKVDVASENEINTPSINSILRVIFELDIRTASMIRPPFGVSIYALGQNPA